MAPENVPEVLEIVIAALIVIGVVNTGLTVLDLADYSYDIDYSEGFFIEDIQRLTGPGALYPEPSLENGFESVKYPPLFYLLLGAAAELMGYSLLTGRILNLAATGAATVMLYLLAREKTGRNFLMLPLMFLTPYLTIFSGLTVRTDMLALALSLAGLYMVTRERLYLALPFFVLSALTKQVFISGFLAATVYLAYEKKIGEKLYNLKSPSELGELYQENPSFWNFVGLYTFAGFLSIGILQLVYPHFLDNILAANMGGFDFRFDLLNWFHMTFLPLFGLAAYYVYIFRDRLLGSYLVFSTLVMLFQMMRGGAWVQSAVQPFAAAVVCVSVLYYRVKETGVYLPISILLMVQLFVFFQAPFVSGSVFKLSSMDDQNVYADRRISEEVRNYEDIYTEHASYLMVDEQESPVEIWGLYEQYASGRISDEQVKDFFRRHNYSSIVTYKRLDNLPLGNYLEENYQLVEIVERRDMLLNREEWRIYQWTG